MILSVKEVLMDLVLLKVGLDGPAHLWLLHLMKVILLLKFGASPVETRRDHLFFAVDERGRVSDSLQRTLQLSQIDVFEGALISTVVNNYDSS